MKILRRSLLPAVLCLTAAAGEPAKTTAPQAAALPTAEEAKARARLLHAAFDGTLRIMHRDFFRKGDTKAIPSESLKDVFKTMAEENGVTLRWLASDEKEYTAVEKGTLRYAGVIVLQNQCLKCHVPDRKTLEDRYAALEISMPAK